MQDQTLNPYRAPIDVGRKPRPEVEPAPDVPLRRFREPLIAAALVAIILVAYWGVWHFDFVYFDDPGYVTDNLNVVKGLPLFTDFKSFRSSVYWAFTAFEQSNWHPLTWLSHMLDVQLYGLEAGGHHVTNIIFHVCNTVLLFWLLRVLTGRSWCSAAVAALFAVHPMHVESVVWIAERKDVLSTFLGLLALLSYVHYAKSPSVLRFIPVFVLLALGLLAKPMLVTFPCVCLLLDYWPLGRFNFPWEVESRPSQQPQPVERAAVPRRRAKRNQRIPAARVVTARPAYCGNSLEQIIRLVAEKVPLFVLSLISAAITPYAQNHGGSMASANELSVAFRMENSLQSYMTYITKMFYPGKMTVLYLLDPEHVNHRQTALSVLGLVLITAFVIWGTLRGRRYLAVGWLWYVGTLVPVIGIVQVGEQTYADRYTYIPYVGIFIMIAWGIADLISMLPAAGGALRFAAGFAIMIVLAVCVGWTKFQLQYWTGVEVHLRHALTITPDNWNMLNNLGVYLWKQAQKNDAEAAKAAATGDQAKADEYHQTSLALKADARTQWLHGISSRPTATDIHSNLGYMYSEANDLDNAEKHLTKAVELKDISPRPHNNLGRVLLRRSQQKDAEAREADAKAKTDPAAAEKARQLRKESKERLDAAIRQFERAVELDPSLLEARLNLGEVYLTLNDLDKSEYEYRAILDLQSISVKDQETINNFSQACFGLARIALMRNKPELVDEALKLLQTAIKVNPQNQAAMNLLALQLLQREDYRGAERVLWPLLAQQPKRARIEYAKQFIHQLEVAGKGKAVLEICNFMAWAFATSPEPSILDGQSALSLAQAAVGMTKGQDPKSLDTLAAAFAQCGDFGKAVQAATDAQNKAAASGNRPLADAIGQRLQLYQQQKPYRCDLSGNDRP
jgi:tetratricopeptide (TPR) repeat protein